MNINKVEQLNIEIFMDGFCHPPENESISDTVPFKLKATQKQALKMYAKETKTDQSKIVRQALELYFDYLPHIKTLRKHKDSLSPILNSLS